MKIEFSVCGVPAPGGSKSAFMIRDGMGRPRMRPGTNSPMIVVTDSAGKKNKDWRGAVARAARAAFSLRPLEGVSIQVDVIFFMPRPKGHYRANGELKPSAPMTPGVKPDTLKLMRSTEDALTGIIWKDDALVVKQTLEKRYAQKVPGAHIAIYVQPMLTWGDMKVEVVKESEQKLLGDLTQSGAGVVDVPLDFVGVGGRGERAEKHQ